MASQFQEEPEPSEDHPSQNAGSETIETMEDKDSNSGLSKALKYDPTTAIKPLSGRQLGVVMFTLCFGLFLATVETSITATALVTIGDYFQNSFTTTWVVLGYLLSYMGFSIIFARLSDAIGRRNAILLAWLLFAVFSLASGLAKTLEQLIVFRTMQGIGGSGLYSMSMIVIPQVSPVRLWGLASGMIGAAFACASIVGPILGGLITEKGTWRWIYLFNAPAAGIAVGLFLYAWPKTIKHESQKRSLFLTQIDILGALLLLAASTLLLFALQQVGGTNYGWRSATIISTLAVSGVCWSCFLGWIVLLEFGNTKIGIKPIFPLSVAIQRPTGPAILMAFLVGFPFFIVVINLPIRFQIVNGNSPILSGVHLLPLLAGTAFGSGLGGALSSKKNLTSYSVFAASCLMSIGTGLLSILPTGKRIEPVQYLYQLIMGLGVGISMSSITVMVTLANNYEQLASAQGAVSQARALGGVIGLAVATIVLNQQLSRNLSSVLDPSQLGDLQKSLSTISSLDHEQQGAVSRVFAQSFNGQMRVCMYISLASVLVAGSTWQKDAASVADNKARQDALARAQEIS